MSILSEIGKKHKTDKVSNGYTDIYESFFVKFKDENINVLEIGAGDLGSSHKMWKEYFKNGNVFCFDTFISPIQKDLKDELAGHGVKSYEGNQLSRRDLGLAMESFGVEFDIILDDGAHMPDAIQISLGSLFPFLKTGGKYIVEDLLCAKSRQKRINEVNKKIREFGLDISHEVDIHLSDSFKHFDKYSEWTSNSLTKLEKEYLRDNISWWEFYCNNKLCIMEKKLK